MPDWGTITNSASLSDDTEAEEEDAPVPFDPLRELSGTRKQKVIGISDVLEREISLVAKNPANTNYYYNTINSERFQELKLRSLA